MVFFTCGNCGESIKKPAIAKHYMGKCRGPVNVTCVDCFKDFRGNEYEAHIKCVTEEERYAAKGFVPKASSNKGEKKQQSWFEAVQNILNSDRDLKNDERELLQILSAHENLPRKKGKFINFLTNAHRAYARRQDLVERVWGIIEEAGKAATAGAVTNGTKETVKSEEEIETKKSENGTNGEVLEKPSKKLKRKAEKEAVNEDADVKPKKQKKKKSENVTNGEILEETPQKLNFDTDKVVRDIVKEAGSSLSLNKLIEAIQTHCGSENFVEKTAKMFKKIQKNILVTLNEDELKLECTPFELKK